MKFLRRLYVKDSKKHTVFFHPTKEQAQWWVDHKDEINKIMCLNLKPEDSLCEYVLKRFTMEE